MPAPPRSRLRTALALSTLAPLLATAHAQAQACENARPTDSAGSQGLAYGGATVEKLDSPSGRARVFYATTGLHAPSGAASAEAPEAVVVAALAADDALDKYETLGFAPPLSDADSPCRSNGDGPAVDIYLVNFSAADGQALPDHCQSDDGARRCSGFVLVENDFRGGGYGSVAEGMRTVVPHELFHLVQNAYDADVERFWAEGSAQWAAKKVYPDVTDLERFLPAYFDIPWRPLNVPPSGIITNFLYATAIWPVFLDERYGESTVLRVFESLEGEPNDVLPTTAEVLAGEGSSLGDAFLEFAVHNAATGKRSADSGGYANAANYPEVALEPFDAEEGQSVSDVGSGLGAYYYRVHTDSPLRLVLEADPQRVAAKLVPFAEDGEALLLDAAQPLPAIVEGDAVLVVAGQSLARTDAEFSVVAEAPDGGLDPEMPADSGESDAGGCAFHARSGSAKSWALFVLAGFVLRRRAVRRGVTIRRGYR